jgi:hypothetical protein
LRTELTLQDLPDSVKQIYYLANTPSFLFRMLREDNFVRLISYRDSQELIKLFNSEAEKELKSSDQVAFLYALYIALTFKERNEVGEFFKQGLAIKFDWFADISKLYFQNYIAAPIVTHIPIVGDQPIKQSVIITGDINFHAI